MGSNHSKWGRTTNTRSSWHLNSSFNTEFFIQMAAGRALTWSITSSLTGSPCSKHKISLEGPQRREQTGAWEQTHPDWTTERGADTGLAWPTFWVKATGEIEKSLHLRAGNRPSCVNKYFPSDHVLDAKDIQMIMTTSLFKALCATYFLLQALTNGYGSSKAGIKKQNKLPKHSK